MERRIGGVAALLLAGLLLSAAPAAAGTYEVHACLTSGGKFTNHSWSISVPGKDFTRGSCSASDARPQMAIASAANKQYAAGRRATMTFTAPSGAAISNFTLNRQLYQFNPMDGAPAGNQQLYTLVQLGSIELEGGGVYDAGVRNRLGSHGAWWGNGGAYDTGAGVVNLGSYVEARGYAGNATTLRLTVGCHTSPCSLRTNGNGVKGSIHAALFGARVTINDPTMPRLERVFPSGLAAGGLVGGDEPLTFDATDNAGIKRAEIIDVTPGAEPRAVGVRDFACDYTYARPCPVPRAETVSATGLPAGTRTLVVRLTDGAGNVASGAPFTVEVGGALNGAPASAAARLTASFARNRRTSLNVDYGKRAGIRGQLVDATGTPIAGAVIQVLDRQLRSGTSYALRGEITTGADGRFSLMAARGPARAIRFEYRVRRQSATPVAIGRVEMRVRSSSSLSIRPRTVRAGRSIRISGRLRGGLIPRSGKVVNLQAFDGGRWRTFDTVRARRSARFSTRYRFRRAAGGQSIRFRAQIRRDESYPYYLGYSRTVRVRIR
jgi:hypothetical protein